MKNLKNYFEKLEELKNKNGIKYINDDQEALIKNILKKFEGDEFLLEQIYKLLIQRIKLGFRFDAAPESENSIISLLVKDEKLSINDNFLTNNKNQLIIGENYDALKNLLVLQERERERERMQNII
ncbi:hypothetical protein [[Mycoplasma] collis]|uniref:hypothetical protein n=1 Tax=[Mycoplasma] collis TaxID=2127 RepID=UPI00051C4D08|nr:hypothetical protein [[Mycoplasma] collis]